MQIIFSNQPITSEAQWWSPMLNGVLMTIMMGCQSEKTNEGAGWATGHVGARSRSDPPLPDKWVTPSVFLSDLQVSKVLNFWWGIYMKWAELIYEHTNAMWNAGWKPIIKRFFHRVIWKWKLFVDENVVFKPLSSLAEDDVKITISIY